jgi:hypothetical protein
MKEPHELGEYERHVRDVGTQLTLCGVPVLFGEWVFETYSAARAAKETAFPKYVPCPVCFEWIPEDEA